MISGHVFIATSLDGFIARPDGGLDWLEHPGAGAEDHGYGAFVAGIDGILMGRATFEVVARFDPWPYDRPLIVLSARLGPDAIPPALRDRVTLARTLPGLVLQLQAAAPFSPPGQISKAQAGSSQFR
ncbi:MAG: dihydrofolate reductase family protein, partial [Gemmobacter sp.]